MSHNNNYQQFQELVSSIPSLRTQQKDILCRDCGGISTTKIQQLLSILENTTQLFNRKSLGNKSKNNPRKKNKYSTRKTSFIRRKKKTIIRKRISNSTKQRKLNNKKTRSSRNNNNMSKIKKK